MVRRQGLGDEPFECLAERVRVDRLAVLLGDDQILVLVVRAPLDSFCVLRARVVALRRRADDFVANRDERLADR
jgi:hypothetical protein